jgi:hypothetical protein
MIGEKTIKDIVERIKENSEKVRYGTVSVSLKIHEGNVAVISHETIETTKQKEIIHDDN